MTEIWCLLGFGPLLVLGFRGGVSRNLLLGHGLLLLLHLDLLMWMALLDLDLLMWMALLDLDLLMWMALLDRSVVASKRKTLLVVSERVVVRMALLVLLVGAQRMALLVLLVGAQRMALLVLLVGAQRMALPVWGPADGAARAAGWGQADGAARAAGWGPADGAARGFAFPRLFVFFRKNAAIALFGSWLPEDCPPWFCGACAGFELETLKHGSALKLEEALCTPQWTGSCLDSSHATTKSDNFLLHSAVKRSQWKIVEFLLVNFDVSTEDQSFTSRQFHSLLLQRFTHEREEALLLGGGVTDEISASTEMAARVHDHHQEFQMTLEIHHSTGSDSGPIDHLDAESQPLP
ncbi:hypothetical protein AXG93_1988s1040 [Marchantia polymorpha subsp. ruderalis]|uniref:Uncharacterized protein n=1 Tax=Marchantia polymorpha subsp. ruderalis TaxID=1480154 RepID=A0A176VVG8_MARPO|nr:hypothetical protein AXG93_1988s1040 [Marchantia polymorpha subsp. ruderalis]